MEATRAVEIAAGLDDPKRAAPAHNDLAGILWRRLDFEAARRHYLLAARPPSGSR